MKHYPEDHKKAVIRKVVESALSLRQFAKLESINLSTLYSWRDKYLTSASHKECVSSGYLKAGFSLTDSNNSDVS